MSDKTLAGGCACRAIRFKLSAPPLIVHACHCRDCQRLTGSAFVINMWIERKFVETTGSPNFFRLTAGTGKPHDVYFCGQCGTYLWGFYHAAPGDTLLVRAGTLDQPEAVEPDVHIFTRSKVPWLQLPPTARAFEAFYNMEEIWPAESKARLQQNIAETK